MSFSRLENLLQAGSSNSLEKIISRAQAMEELTTRLRARLADEFSPHLVAANLRPDGELVIICASSTWASRLRYETETLMAAAREAGVPVHKCTIKVRS
jgi:hypothetical protein